MSNFRFSLEKYKSPSSRYTCPKCCHKKCFSKYIDSTGDVKFPDYVGRCNREDKCGYHYSPKDYFNDNPQIEAVNNEPIKINMMKDVKASSFLPYSYVDDSLAHYHKNNLFQYLKNNLGTDITKFLFRKYQVGTANHWQGATVFWQIDQDKRVRTGKVMLYDPDSGRRVKHPHSYINWVHSILKLPDYNLDQCFFGEHLLNENPDLPVAIVESEKSAIIASCYLPQYLWLATGGKHGCFNEEHLKVLIGRKTVLFPDLGALAIWEEKAKVMKERVGIETYIFDYLEKNASIEDIREGYDIADYLLQQKPQAAIYETWIKNNPILQSLVDTFGLSSIDGTDGLI